MTVPKCSLALPLGLGVAPSGSARASDGGTGRDSLHILLSSYFFDPSVGGIEQVSLALAQEFVRAGHAVKVVTSTAERGATLFPFEVIRRPTPTQLITAVRWCDVVFHNNISLGAAWPLAFIRRPWVIAHHTWISRTDGSVGPRDRLKGGLTRFAGNIAISAAVADHLAVPSAVIGNPYRDDLFQRDPSAVRDRDLIFVGRLVSDKGVNLLVEALGLLKARDCRPTLTVVGSGPERPGLQMQVAQAQLERQVTFAGTKSGTELVALLNRHRTLVVPSRWQEPFGLVALEGMACGCRVIVAECRGLREAAGTFSLGFEQLNSLALANVIEHSLNETFDWNLYWQRVDEHLREHRAAVVAERYLKVLTHARSC